MLLSKMGYRGGKVDGGETEARRTRGLDLRRREHLDVEMSAWRQGTTTARGFAPTGDARVRGCRTRSPHCSVPLIRRVLTGHSLRHRISDI
jgi:hypothetical protein